MLPFTGIDFFLLSAIFLLSVYAVKAIAGTRLPLKWLLLTGSLIYVVWYVPHAVSAFAFLTYTYLVYYCAEYVIKSEKKWPAVILLLAPMILVKASVAVDIISFTGLSYITFRVIQIYLDNNRNEKPVRPEDYALFMFFTPTLMIGPIDRFKRFNDDVKSGFAALTITNFTQGWEMVLLGLVQKFVLAEAINRYLLSPLNTESTSLSEMLSNMYVYAFYLYFDFAGYSSLAAGFAKLIGINVPQNFNNPFIAVNPQDFWRRWHASLSDWLRDYLFRPYYKWISGKEKLKPYPLFKQNSGLFLTFLVMGLWNGFKSNYILSGVLFGVYSVVHNTYVVRSRQAGRDIVFGSLNEVAVKWISVFLMFNLACIALYVFSGRCPLL